MAKQVVSRSDMCALLVFVFAGFGFLATLHAEAQNVVSNSSLDTRLSPWALFVSGAPDPAGTGSMVWAASPDVDNNPNSGSAADVIDTSSPVENEASGMSQCVNFNPTTVNFVNYGMSFQVPNTTTADGSINATIEIRLFAATNCANFVAGGNQGRTLTPDVPSDTIWYTAGDTNLTVSPATSAQSAKISAYLRETDGGSGQSNYKVYFDKLHLVLNGTTPVQLQEFGVD